MRISDWSSDVCSSDLGAPDRIGTLPVGFQQLRTHQSARAAPRSVRARRQPDPFARKKQIAIDVDDARGGTVYQPHHLIVHSEPRARAGATVAAARVGDQRQAFAFAPDYSAHHAASGVDPNLRSEEHTSELQSLMSM